AVGATPAPGALPRSISIGSPPGPARNHRRQPPFPNARGLSSTKAYPACDPARTVTAPSPRGLAKMRSGSAAPGTYRQISEGPFSPAVHSTSPSALIGASAGTYRASRKWISIDAGSIVAGEPDGVGVRA